MCVCVCVGGVELEKVEVKVKLGEHHTIKDLLPKPVQRVYLCVCVCVHVCCSVL